MVSSTRVTVGDSVKYRLSVSNRGPDPAPAPIVVRDALPTGLDLVSAHGRGWKCTVDRQADVATCKRSAELAAHEKAPPIFVVATVTASAPSRVVNTAEVKAKGDVKPANNKGVAPLTVSSVPSLPDTGFRVDALRSLSFRW